MPGPTFIPKRPTLLAKGRKWDAQSLPVRPARWILFPLERDEDFLISNGRALPLKDISQVMVLAAMEAGGSVITGWSS